MLKPRGHPVGIQISQTTDANSSFWAIMWCFGGKVLEADGKTIAMESPEKEGEYARARGWPAKPNEYVQLTENNYILPNMAAKAVTGTPIKKAIRWGVEQVRKVFAG